MTRVCALMRLTGRLWIAAANEIDRAFSDYRVEIPSVIPDWVNEESNL